MGRNKNNKCKICLKKTNSAKHLVSGWSVRELLETLFIDLGITTNENYLICTNCVQKIQQAFAFKTLCLDREHLLPNYDAEALKRAHSKQESNEESHVNIAICRLCKNALDRNIAISLKEMLNIEKIKEIFQKHIPELDLLPMKNPFICEVCWNHLVDFQFLLALIHQKLERKEIQLNRGIKTNNIKNITISMLQKHPKVVKITRMKKLYVGKRATVETNLNSHEEVCDKRSQEIDTNTSRGMTTPEKQKIKCCKCTFESEDPSAHQKHMNFVHIKIYQCDWCSFTTTTKMFLNTHLSNHIKITNPCLYHIYKCELCDFQTTVLENLKQHIDKHM